MPPVDGDDQGQQHTNEVKQRSNACGRSTTRTRQRRVLAETVKACIEHGALHAGSYVRDDGWDEGEHERNHEQEPSASPELAIIVREDAGRHGLMDTPGDFASPSIQVAVRHNRSENRDEVDQRQQAHLSKPSRGVLDIVPRCLEVFNLHVSAPHLLLDVQRP